MIDVIISEANFPTSMWVARSLARKGVKVCGIANGRSGCIYSRYYFCKVITDKENYYSALENYLLKSNAILFPHLEKTYLYFLKRTDECSVIAPPKELAFKVIDKSWVMQNLLNHFPEILPETLIIDTKKMFSQDLINILKNFLNEHFKIIIKTSSEIGIDYGPGKRYLVVDKIEKLYSEDFKNFINMHKNKKIIVQNYVEGTGVGIGGVWYEGRALVVGGHRRLRMSHNTGGVSTLAESYMNQKILDAAINIMQLINYTGIALVEFKYDEKNDKIYFMEINPRIWGTLPLYIVSGADIPWVAYRFYKFGEISFNYTFKTGIRLKFFYNDLFSIFRNYKGIHFIQNLLNSLNPFNAKEVLFSFSDPLPFLFETIFFTKRSLKFLARKVLK